MRTRGFLQTVAVTMTLAYGALPVHAGERTARAEGGHEAAASGCGETWTARTSGTTAIFDDAAWTGTQLVLVGGMVSGSNAIFTSPDGVTWTPHAAGTTLEYRGVTWTGTQLVAVGWAGAILTSPEGITWTSRASGTAANLYGVTWTGSQLVAVGQGGMILTSPDGVAWTERSSGVSANLFDVTWTGSQLVTVGEDATILTSPDGIAWTRRTSSANLDGVTWTGTQLAAVGVGGAVATSPDGVTWTWRTSGTSVVLDHVTSATAKLVAVGWGGTVLTSPDGVTWTSRASGTSANLFGVTWTGSQLVAVGSAGTILTSPCSAPAYPYSVWVPVASHNSGKNNSQWRSDLGLLNAGSVTANAQITLFLGDVLASNTTYVPAGTQSILTDVVGQLGASGSGALNILSDQPFKVTSRSYNEVSSGASCYAGGTQGQDYPAVATGDGLVAGQSAYLAGLAESASYRCNIGVVNTGTVTATVLVELFDGSGTKLTDYTVSLAAGHWAQETQPYFNIAGQTAMDRGYAKITVQSGSGGFAFASVIDNITNDPTTVAMQR